MKHTQDINVALHVNAFHQNFKTWKKNQFSNYDLKIVLICPTIDSWYILQHQRLQTSLYCARPVSWSRKECEMYEDVNHHIYLYNNKIYTAINRKMTFSIRAMGKLGTYSIYQDFVTDIMKLPPKLPID